MEIMSAKLNTLVNKLSGLVEAFGASSDDSHLARTSEELMRLLEDFQTAAINRSEDHIYLAKIDSAAVNLWNLSVAKRSGKKFNATVNAKAKYVACHLTFFASSPEMTEISCRKKLSMTLKTGKAWLDCSNASMAESSFLLAIECWSKLQIMRDTRLVDEKDSIPDEEQMIECETNILKVYGYRSEVAISMQDDKTAQECIQKAKTLLVKHPKQSSMISKFCYNFGVEYYQKGSLESSVFWLRESYDIGKRSEDDDASQKKIQATCLRLIAKAYLGLGGEENIKKALNSVDLSITEESNVRSFYLKLKILLEQKDDNESYITTTLDEALQHRGLKIDLAIQIIKIFVQSNRKAMMSRSFETLTKRFTKPPELTNIQLENLEYLIEDKQLDAAKNLVKEHLIKGIKQLSQNDAAISKKFHLLIWEQASNHIENKDYEDALIWYDFSMDCFSKSEHESNNIAKLQAIDVDHLEELKVEFSLLCMVQPQKTDPGNERNRASCFLGMRQYDQALSSVKEAESLEPESEQTYFMKFKISLATTDDGAAIQCIEKLGELALEDPKSTTVHGFICLAAQLAFQERNWTVAAAALEKIIRQATEAKQILTSLRCLARLKYTYLTPDNEREEVQAMLAYVKKAYETLQRSCSTDNEDEVQWFVKIAWNLGITCQENFKQMYEFFVLCYELSLLLASGASKAQQKTCLLMASAAGIETVKELKDENEKNRILHDVQTYIQKCEQVYQELKAEDSRKDKPDPTLAILISLEFEVQARLGAVDLEGILEKAKSIPDIDTRTFESMAAIAFGLSRNLRSVGIKSLKIAIKLHLDKESTDYKQLSRDLHTLVSISLQQGGLSNTQSKEEAFQYYQHVFKIIQQAEKNSYPEMEVLWLMTKAWNCGVHFFSAREYEFCEKWCGMAMKMLDQLDTLKSNYDTHMTSVFADMLERKQRITVRGQVEE